MAKKGKKKMNDEEFKARIGFAIHQTMPVPPNMETEMVNKIMTLKTDSENFTKSLGPVDEDAE